MPKSYPSNLTKAQFNEIEPYLPKKKQTKPRTWTYHEIFNGIMYVLVSGCQWRMLPTDLPPWETVYYYFNNWQKDGTLEIVLKKINKKISYHYGAKPITN